MIGSGRFWRRWRSNPAMALLILVIALALGITARAYSTAKVESNANLVLVENDAMGKMAVETFPVEIALQGTTTLDEEDPLAGDDPGIMGLTGLTSSSSLVDAQVVCGRVTNNLGVALTSLAVHGAIGVSVPDVYNLAPGESVELYCDGSVLEPGYHELTGVLVAEWDKGRAEINFAVEVTVLEPEEPEEEEEELEGLDEEGSPADENEEGRDGDDADAGDDEPAQGSGGSQEPQDSRENEPDDHEGAAGEELDDETGDENAGHDESGDQGAGGDESGHQRAGGDEPVNEDSHGGDQGNGNPNPGEPGNDSDNDNSGDPE